MIISQLIAYCERTTSLTAEALGQRSELLQLRCQQDAAAQFARVNARYDYLLARAALNFQIGALR